MYTDVEDLEIIVDLEKIEKKLSDGEKKMSDLKEYHAKLVDRLRAIESRPTITVRTSEELKELLTPVPPDLSALSLYEPNPLDLSGYYECCESCTPVQVSDEEVGEEVERQLEQWRATLHPVDRAVLRGEVNISEVTPQGDCKENDEVKPQIVESKQFESNGQVYNDVISMDIELTAEVPKGVIVTPVTDVKTSRRACALRSHQTDSVKRVRRSARF